MKEFKIGDEVWFFWTDCGRYVFKEDGTGIFPKNLYIEHGVIVGMNPNKDYVHVYIEGQQDTCRFSYAFHDECFFESIEKALEEMTIRLMNINS